MGSTSYNQAEVLKDMGEYEMGGMCLALSLYWIKFHATDWGGQGNIRREARINQLKSVSEGAKSLQQKHAALSSQFMRNYSSEYDFTKNHDVLRLKLALVGKLCNRIGSIEVDNPSEGWLVCKSDEAGVSRIVDFMCRSGTYHLLVTNTNEVDGVSHATAVHYGGAWFTMDTYFFDPNMGELDSLNKSVLKQFLNERVKDSSPSIVSMEVTRIKRSA